MQIIACLSAGTGILHISLWNRDHWRIFTRITNYREADFQNPFANNVSHMYFAGDGRHRGALERVYVCILVA